jgi:hypothetical protein
MTISNFTNERGNKVENQFIIQTSEATYFKSYNSNIVKTTFEDNLRVIYLDEFYWNYSKTTAKYRNQFLGETTKEIQEKIDTGIYKLIDLN